MTTPEVAGYSLQQAQRDIAALRGQYAHLLANATFLNLSVDTLLTLPDGTLWNASGLAVSAWANITLDAGWTTPDLSRAAPRYRLIAKNLLQLNGSAAFTAGSGAHNLNNSNPLAAAFRPTNPCDFQSTDATGSRLHMAIGTNGVITATFASLVASTTSANAAPSGTWHAEMNAIIALD